MRINALDALRGLASLWVVLHHSLVASMDAMGGVGVLKFTPLRFLLGARPPVIFFFVLSGFVLALACSRRGAGFYPAFAIRRICRIYIPFLVVILSSAAIGAAVAVGEISGATDVLNVMWRDFSANILLRHALMTGVVGETGLDTPMWSLVQEMRISLVFPLLVTLVAMAGWRIAGTLAVLIFTVSWFGLHRLGQDAVGYYAAVSPQASAMLTVYFLFPFLIGIAIAQNRERLIIMARGLQRKGRAVFWMLVAAVTALPSVSPGMDAAYSLAAGTLIVLTLASLQTQGFLARQAMQWLGRVSYSLYLVHLPLLAALAHLTSKLVPFLWIALIAPLASLLVAHLAYKAIETPSIALGRRLALAFG